MPKKVKVGSKNVEGTLEQHTYASSVDNMVRNDRPFEGTTTSLPPSGTNPMIGADGNLASKKISKVK